MTNKLKSYLKKRLQQELPWKIAHAELAPYRKITFDKSEIKNAKKSAVLVLFYVKNNELYLALMQRATYKGTHSGQISFSGGKQEQTDKNSIETALREANEEIGIIATDVAIVGQLTNVYIPVSNFYVTPIVGILNYYPNFIIDKHEVKEVVEVKLTNLMNAKIVKQKIKLSTNTTLKVPSFVFNDKIIWGATALILNELKYILTTEKKS